MKYQARFTTVSGSTYLYSWMSGKLFKVSQDGSREHVVTLDDPGEAYIRTGHRATFRGYAYWSDLGWVHGRRYITSVVTGVAYEPDDLMIGRPA